MESIVVTLSLVISLFWVFEPQLIVGKINITLNNIEIIGFMSNYTMFVEKNNMRVLSLEFLHINQSFIESIERK